jgi:hypothetical protein
MVEVLMVKIISEITITPTTFSTRSHSFISPSARLLLLASSNSSAALTPPSNTAALLLLQASSRRFFGIFQNLLF